MDIDPATRGPHDHTQGSEWVQDGLVRQHFWIAKRLGYGIAVLFVVSVVVFAATQALPSDPARAILGKNATPELVESLREHLGLNRPLFEQYYTWLGGMLSGDLGESLATGEPTGNLVWPRLLNTVSMLFLTLAVAVPVSVILGVITATRRGGRLDRATLLLCLGVTALPEFVIGMTLVILFGTTVWQVLPAVASIPPGSTPFSHLREVALPVLALTLGIVPYLYRQVRGSMIDVLESDYIVMARLKGLPNRRVTMRHALRNALVPGIQATALMMIWLLGGVVVIEYLFNFPGLGSLLTNAIGIRDMPVIQAVVLTFAAGVVLFNLIADVLTVYVTPRLRTGGVRR